MRHTLPRDIFSAPPSICLNSMYFNTILHDEKVPLKDYIFRFTRDAHYRDGKTKERSLRLVKGPTHTVSGKPSGDKVIAMLDDFSPLCFGMWSINVDVAGQKYPNGIPVATGETENDSSGLTIGLEWAGLSKMVNGSMEMR